MAANQAFNRLTRIAAKFLPTHCYDVHFGKHHDIDTRRRGALAPQLLCLSRLFNSIDAMKTYLDWSAYKDSGMGDAYADIPKTGGDFAKAVAVCIKSGICETKPKGVMCPSFRVSDDPTLSTGGRVRLLKMALNGELGELPFTDLALAKTMELCLGCKGCKRECENAVDMAMIKIEYLAQRYAVQQPSLRTRLLGNIADWYHRYPVLKRLPALHNRYSWLARLNERLLGITSERSLPVPAEQGFVRNASRTHGDNGEVVLLVDTFTRNFNPENACAAIELLETAGYRVHVAQAEDNDVLCCGRTQLAHGLIDDARRHARRMLTVLLPHVEAGRPVIGLEPACLLAVRDDYKSLGLGETAERVAKQAILLEEFIAREHQAKRFNLEFDSLDKAVLIHGHCHQKAVGAMKSMRKVLKLIPKLKFDLIESSCCGMAGSFGIEKENTAMAMQMAELTLLPTLRDNPDATVVANGFSCRHQIREGCEHRPIHIAVLLRDAMKRNGVMHATAN
jgi:glycerol-3-phosphate dehydrogenase subunit C